MGELTKGPVLTVEGPWKGAGSSSSPWRGAWHLRPLREQRGLCVFGLRVWSGRPEVPAASRGRALGRAPPGGLRHSSLLWVEAWEETLLCSHPVQLCPAGETRRCESDKAAGCWVLGAEAGAWVRGRGPGAVGRRLPRSAPPPAGCCGTGSAMACPGARREKTAGEQSPRQTRATTSTHRPGLSPVLRGLWSASPFEAALVRWPGSLAPRPCDCMRA